MTSHRASFNQTMPRPSTPDRATLANIRVRGTRDRMRHKIPKIRGVCHFPSVGADMQPTVGQFVAKPRSSQRQATTDSPR